jgi:hypothetical protein
MWPFTRSMAARTRPTTLSASRRQRRPGLECLEEKKLLATVFGSYPDGTWAYNDAAGWRHLTTAIPMAMHEGPDGTLYASYNSGSFTGTFRYDYGPNRWTELTSATTSTLTASMSFVDANAFFATYSNGTWEFDGSWHLLTSAHASQLAAVSADDVYMSFNEGANNGTWHYDGGWDKITAAIPTVMDATRDGALYASYSDGTWEYDGGWTKLTSSVATSIAAITDNDWWGSFSNGTYAYFDGSVYASTTAVATHLGHSTWMVIGSFSDGTWTYDELNNPNWNHIDTDHASRFG